MQPGVVAGTAQGTAVADRCWTVPVHVYCLRIGIGHYDRSYIYIRRTSILTVGGNPSDYLTCHGDNPPHARNHTGSPHKTDFHTPEVTETGRGTRR